MIRSKKAVFLLRLITRFDSFRRHNLFSLFEELKDACMMDQINDHVRKVGNI